MDAYKRLVADWNEDVIVAQAKRSANAFRAVERIMRAATRIGDPDQLDLFLDHLKDQDRLEECR